MTEASYFDQEIAAWTQWIADPANCFPPARSYFLTVTFDRYRDRYFSERSDMTGREIPNRIVREHVLAGMTRKLSPDQAAAEYVSDVNRWYLRLLNALFGGQYRKQGPLHPRGVGWIDAPIYKRASKPAGPKHLPGDEFPHAHIILAIPETNMLPERFEQLWTSGELGRLWRRFNSEGELHVKEADNVGGALDYAAKTAKWNPLLRVQNIVLPVANWAKTVDKAA